MLTIEEYISKRKKEDGINEFNIEEQNENMRLCVNYVFEYFNNYLLMAEGEEKTVLKDEKLLKYSKVLKDYEPEIRHWLVDIYAEYGKQLNKSLPIILKKDIYFYLYNKDSEFRSLSYECYSKLINKNLFLKDKTEMLFLLIKDYHRIKSEMDIKEDEIIICEEIDQWIKNTWKKYNVNILAFANEWINYFCDNEDIWPTDHRKKSECEFRKYDYDFKQKSNLFNLDSLYRKMPKKAFTRGKKQEFEMLFMYIWLNDIEGDEDVYWEEYYNKTIQAIRG